MACGWNLWVWLECGYSGCCCTEVHVYSYIDILIIIITCLYSTCIVLALFWQQHTYFVSFITFLLNIIIGKIHSSNYM